MPRGGPHLAIKIQACWLDFERDVANPAPGAWAVAFGHTPAIAVVSAQYAKVGSCGGVIRLVLVPISVDHRGLVNPLEHTLLSDIANAEPDKIAGGAKLVVCVKKKPQRTVARLIVNDSQIAAVHFAVCPCVLPARHAMTRILHVSVPNGGGPCRHAARHG